MTNKRIQNLLFALALGVVLGVTAWSIYSREPWLFSMPSVPLEDVARQNDIVVDSAKQAEEAVESIDEASEKTGGVPNRPRGETDKMIDEGRLSGHPAMYFRKVEK